jgi:hypothetical protein
MAARCRRRSHPSKTAASASLSTACGSASHIESAVRCAVPIRPSDGRQPHEPISHADRNDSLGGGPTGGATTPQFRVKTRRSVRLWCAMQEREKAGKPYAPLSATPFHTPSFSFRLGLRFGRAVERRTGVRALPFACVVPLSPYTAFHGSDAVRFVRGGRLRCRRMFIVASMSQLFIPQLM